MPLVKATNESTCCTRLSILGLGKGIFKRARWGANGSQAEDLQRRNLSQHGDFLQWLELDFMNDDFLGSEGGLDLYYVARGSPADRR